jgi:hypothetical protein
MRGLMDWTRIVVVDMVVNSIGPPISITFHCEHVLEFNHLVLQLSGFPRVEVSPSTGHCLLQLYTEQLNSWGSGNWTVNWHCPPNWFTVTLGAAFSQQLVLVNHMILTGASCQAWTNVLVMYSPLWWSLMSFLSSSWPVLISFLSSSCSLS